MAFQQTLSVKLLANDAVINPKPSKRLEDIEATVAGEIRKAHGSRAASAWSAGEKLQRLFHGRRKTLRQFGSKKLVQASFLEIPEDLIVHIGYERFGLEKAQ